MSLLWILQIIGLILLVTVCANAVINNYFKQKRGDK